MRIDKGVATTWMVVKLSERIFITTTIPGASSHYLASVKFASAFDRLSQLKITVRLPISWGMVSEMKSMIL